ncbi:hypothetical protein SPHINGO391_510072 [Sphingomonas aurantiaca]|uniref:Uncharacterized protein n=1 Tax=Sphingomonas aurantiaca TaxID=185949 RepID=A0A5E8ACI1_9SPHN|nr:hypothetical protein SPHINGO391_510072 [Sphingomonas aurantiaca]
MHDVRHGVQDARPRRRFAAGRLGSVRRGRRRRRDIDRAWRGSDARRRIGARRRLDARRRHPAKGVRRRRPPHRQIARRRDPGRSGRLPRARPTRQCRRLLSAARFYLCRDRCKRNDINTQGALALSGVILAHTAGLGRVFGICGLAKLVFFWSDNSSCNIWTPTGP